MSTQAVTDAGDSYQSDYHLYEPHKAGLPKLGVYFKELWQRREFATEMSKASMRGANSMTFFGQAWLVINPLLLAAVYYFIVNVLSSGNRTSGWQYFSHLTGGLFLFYYFQGAVNTGANSVVSAGKLVLNTAFPRLLMPLSAVRTGFYRFLPTLAVYVVFHILAGNPWNLNTFITAPIFLVLITMFAAGLASVFAALQVYFRDTASFLPYFMRLWLYCSPVLWTIDMIDGHAGARALAPFNPLYPLIGGYGEALQNGTMPSLDIWLAAVGWAVLACAIGFGYFMSRERDFAVRL
ncbi:ABC transporter permease [Piscicoccus intestinalis]|uniref:ABC transporter permease n=1 Tax=Piscicoccus intestinalis TaxID=746033 RepID=UPI00083952F1|nr:ABC transporter permease [Piscicoccus intestinalis]